VTRQQKADVPLWIARAEAQESSGASRLVVISFVGYSSARTDNTTLSVRVSPSDHAERSTPYGACRGV
jgi:hypothetical protein